MCETLDSRSGRGRIENSLAAWILVALVASTPGNADEPLVVCATTPDLGSLTREVGGDSVTVVELTKGPQDPHYVEARPSLIKQLSKADLFIQTGLELESGWSPVLLRSARNANVLPGAPGFVDASSVIAPLDVPTTPIDRSLGDVHARGNPHYLLDPLNGLKVARLIRDRLRVARPEHASQFEERYREFRSRLLLRVFGQKLLGEYNAEQIEKLLVLADRGGMRKLLAFIEAQGQRPLLGGWLAAMAPYAGRKIVADHDLWPYFSHRFGPDVVGFLEPKPGVAPSSKHLVKLIGRMQTDAVGVVLASPYFDGRHARLVASRTRARVARMAHQVGARPGTESYLRMIDYNVREFLRAVEATR